MPKSAPPLIRALTMPGFFCLLLAFCGFTVVVANLLGLPQSTQMIFPAVRDLPALMSSTLLLAVVGLTPYVVKSVFAPRPPREETSR